MALTTSASSSNLGNKPKWYFTDEEILHLPSQKAGMSPSGELRGRREAAEFICDMGEYLNQSMPQNRHNISSCCVFVAIVHMHRFYTVHPITVFTPKEVAAACLFMTGKSEECPRKLEHIVEAWFKLKHWNAEVQPPFNDISRKRGADLIVYLEQILLQTIGFDLHVTIPHSIILSNKDKLKYENELVNIAYWFATDIIKWTNWAIRYSEQTIACVCIHAASTWADHEIPETTAGTPWFKDIDPNMTEWLLQKLVREFTPVYEQFGARSKNCVRHFIKNAKNGGNPSTMHPMPATNSIAQMPHPMPATNSISRMPQIPANSIAQIPRMPASSIAQMPATSSIVQMPQLPVNSSIAYYQLLPPPPPPPVLPQSVKKEPVINDGTPKQHSIHPNPRQMMILNTR